MTDVEEALLWAREQLATFWEKAPGVRDADRAVHVNNARSGASDGDLEEAVRGRLHWLDGNRAGAAASAERIKELEARVAELERRLSGVPVAPPPPPTGPAYDPRLIGAYFDYARAMYGGRGGGGQG